MGSLETVSAICRSSEPIPGHWFSFPADILDEKSFISITPSCQAEKKEQEIAKDKFKNAEFEFLSSNLTSETVLTADELFFEGRLLPFSQMHQVEKLNSINLKTDYQKTEIRLDAGKADIKEERKMSWFLDDDPSPRPPKCTVLWKELLKLRKQCGTSTLLPSTSTSSYSSYSASISNVHLTDEGKNGSAHKDMYARRIKKGLERTRSASMRIRPMVNVPVSPQGKNRASLFPLFSLKKGRLTER